MNPRVAVCRHSGNITNIYIMDERFLDYNFFKSESIHPSSDHLVKKV